MYVSFCSVHREVAASLLPTRYGVWGSAVSSPSGVLGGASAAVKFSCILEAPESHSWNLLGAKFGGHGFLAPPLKSARARGISMWHGQVSEYENAIEDIANVASDHVLLVDSAANYAVYNATTRVNILDTFVAVLSSQSAARVCVCVHITLLLTTS